MCNFPLGALDRRLVDRLLQLKPFPGSLLEMGCGEGRKLLALKHAHNVAVCGVDTHEPSLSSLTHAGVETMTCDMRRLPFDDGAFDWVLIANSMHHVLGPGDALKEGARVARHGVVICEPWWDLSISSQRTTHALCHRTGLSAGEILELVDFNAASAEIHCELEIERWDVQQWLADFAPWLEKLSRDHYLRWRLNELLRTLPTATATRPGQVVVVVRKAAA
jgi:SAM-dependent methyltransferase